MFSSCGTYNRFYGETARTTSIDNNTRRLDLSYQNLTELNLVYDKLQSLLMLDLSGNVGIDISLVLSSIPNPEKMEVIILDSLGLKVLPEELKKCTNLKQLSLGYNPDLDIEEAIADLEGIPLVFLNLKGNKMKSVPQNITSLPTIRDLNLSYNQIHDNESYKLLGELPELYSLWLDHNELVKLPTAIGEISQIRYFYVDHNKLTSLPKEILGMKKLWTIHAGYNRFTKLPEELMEMPKLILAHMNNNSISEIPRSYGEKNYSMKALLLDHNPLSIEERAWAEKTFKTFFLLSFKQTF